MSHDPRAANHATYPFETPRYGSMVRLCISLSFFLSSWSLHVRRVSLLAVGAAAASFCVRGKISEEDKQTMEK